MIALNGSRVEGKTGWKGGKEVKHKVCSSSGHLMNSVIIHTEQTSRHDGFYKEKRLYAKK